MLVPFIGFVLADGFAERGRENLEMRREER
jgi:hypothetical protein